MCSQIWITTVNEASNFVCNFVCAVVWLFNFELLHQISRTGLNSFHITFASLNRYSVIS
ncbi:MAG: hypothetical protein ACTS46_00685 [Candidatus Hodgkinia cicadicola]